MHDRAATEDRAGATAWTAQRLGIVLTGEPGPLGVELADLVGLAVRRNPRRAHLLVSTVLGKHRATDPALIRGAALLLGRLAAQALGRADADGAPEGALCGGKEVAVLCFEEKFRNLWHKGRTL